MALSVLSMEKKFGFQKAERLCSRNIIQSLFTEGQSFVKYPLRVSILKLPTEVPAPPAQVLISVTKKRFKRANKRNLLKRKIREAYRLNKHILTDVLKKQEDNYAIAFIYLPSETMEFADIEKGMIKALRKIVETVTTIKEQSHE